MATTIVGLKIRETRRALGLSQSDLARQMGISPAYLNLIEFSKRRIGGKLLKKAADCLGLQPADLDGAAELRLVHDLREIVADPRLRPAGIGPDSIEAFVGRFPEWAEATARLYRSDAASRDLATALSDRLTHDPYLGEIVHQMLTHISAIRSTSEILDEIEDIAPAQRDRFHRALTTESHRLSDVGQALASYFDKAHTADHAVTPAEEIESFLLAHDNHFPSIEEAAAAHPNGRTAHDEGRDSDTGFDEWLDAAVTTVLADSGTSLSAVARQPVEALLRTYAADALLLPAEPFLDSAARLRFDLDALGDAWGVGVDRICRRLTAVSGRTDKAREPRFAYLSCNAAGQTIDRRPLADFPIPRHGAGCPLWAVYRAFSTPESAVRQMAQFPEGKKMLFVARARRTGPAGFGQPVNHVADMVAVPAAQAEPLVYADGLDLGPRGPAEPVGPNCRICPREGCAHRTGDPLVGRLQA